MAEQDKQQEAFHALVGFLTAMREAAENKQHIPMFQTEEDRHRGFQQDACPHKLCDGSGYNSLVRDGERVTVRCRCYEDAVMRTKLKNSNIQVNFWPVELADLKQIDDKIQLTHLKPKLKQGERKTDQRKKVQDPETPDAYVARTYDTKLMHKGLHHFSSSYVDKVLALMAEEPRAKTLNLMLMGDPGKGKTHLACAIAKEFLRRGKSVHFTRMRTLLDEAYDQKSLIRELVRTKELLVIDELGQEYHTDSQWALKQIQDIFKERQETGLPTICTTNAYPNELEQYYEGSLMSTFHGRFLMMLLHGDYDLRVLEARHTYEELDFLND